MRSLAAPRDLMALDAEGSEHDAQRQVHRLEHRALLDVQLEVRRGVRELRAGLESAVEIHAVLPQRIGQRDAVQVAPPAELVLIRHRAGDGR